MGTTMPLFFAGFLEFAHDRVALRGRGVNGHQVVVVQIDAPGSDFPEHGYNFYWRQIRAHNIAKRISPAIAQRPQSKREPVDGFWLVCSACAHGISLLGEFLTTRI